MASGDERAASGGGGAGPVRRTVRVLVVGLLAMLANGAPQLATGTPGSTYQWILLVAGAFADAVVVAASLGRLYVVAPSRFRIPAAVRPWLRMRVLGSVALALSLLVGTGFAAGKVWSRVDRSVNGCPEPTQLRVLTTVDSLVPTRQLARAFERDTADGGCPVASVYVYAATDAQTSDALDRGWAADALRDLGPRPDVWLPDSTLEVDALLARATREGRTVPVARGNPVVAWSPIVVGVPGPAVQANAVRTELAWDDLLGRAGQLPGGLVRPDPDTSLIGELATTSMYSGPDATRAHSPRDVELDIQHSLDAGGFPLGDTLDELDRLRDQAPPPPTAVVTSEQALVRFNTGEPSGGDCTVPPAPAGPALLAFYPKDTSSLDHPFVPLHWGGRPTPQSRAAARFGQWLRGGGGHAALACVGLRPSLNGDLDAPLTQAYGTLPNASFVGRAPDSSTVDEARQKYATARRAGRVLLALDTSSSMGQTTATGGTRLSVAATGVENSLGDMAAGDEFGLWTFPGPGAHATRQLIPIGPRDTPVGGQPRADATTNALNGLRPTGGTPLLSAIIDGVNAVDVAAGDRIKALVVLTDGEDTSGLTAQSVLEAVKPHEVRVFVIAVGEASCAGQVAAVASGTGGGCYEASFETVGMQLGQVFDLLWEGAKDRGGA